MDAFPFTDKKFTAMSNLSQHRWLIKWLTRIYKKLTTNRTNQQFIETFYFEYSKAVSLMDITAPKKPDSFDSRIWIEFVSESIHFHRKKIGINPKDNDLLEKVSTKDLSFARKPGPSLDYHVALDSIRSLFNVGSIFRSCEAAGFDSIILGNTLGSEHQAVRKTAMGTHEWINSKTTDNLFDELMEKKRHGYEIIGVETVRDCKTYNSYPWPLKGIVVFGNEEYGISSGVMEICDNFVNIPMFGRKNSINVANAVSIVVFHIAQSLRK